MKCEVPCLSRVIRMLPNMDGTAEFGWGLDGPRGAEKP